MIVYVYYKKIHFILSLFIVEVQNSPLAMQQNSPLTQENSPLAQNSPGQNHSPYQSYSPIHQSHSPIHQTPSPIQSNSPPPLLDEKPFSTSISSSCSVGKFLLIIELVICFHGPLATILQVFSSLSGIIRYG